MDPETERKFINVDESHLRLESMLEQEGSDSFGGAMLKAAKPNPRKRGGAAYPKRSGMNRRKLRAKQLAPPVTQERTNALLNAALKVWCLKHGYND